MLFNADYTNTSTLYFQFIFKNKYLINRDRIKANFFGSCIKNGFNFE